MSQGANHELRVPSVVLASVLALSIACGSPRAPSPESRAPSVSMPDISGAAQPVQTQLRDAYAALQQKIANPTTPAAELAAAYGDMGKLFLATEYLDAAETCFLNAQTLEPNDRRWPYFLAHIHRRRNEPGKAAALFERVLALESDNVPALVWLGDMRLVEGNPGAAEAPLAKAQALAPREAAAFDRAGRAALARRDYATAVKDLGAALEIQPQATSLHYPLSLAYRALGDTRNADAHLRLRGDVATAVNDPLMRQVASLLQNATAFEVRGADALGKRQWPEAVANLRQALELAPDNAFTHLNLGTALFETGDAAGALREFRTAATLSPGLAKAHYGIGIVLEAAGKDREAVDAFSAAVRSDPSLVEARMSFADALRRTGRVEESLPQYAEVIKANPAISQARFGHVMALVRLRRYTQARDELEVDVSTYPDQPGFAHALARLLAASPDDRARDGARALSLVQELLKAQRTIELAQTMAMALAEAGRFDEAVRWQKEAISAAAQAGRTDLTARLSENLGRYERGQPCRTPWPDTDPVFHPRPAR